MRACVINPGVCCALRRERPRRRRAAEQRDELAASPVAVGTRVSSRAPRTEPYVRLSRIRLPPRVCDGKAIARPRMEDDRFREPRVHQLRHPLPTSSDPSGCDAVSVRRQRSLTWCRNTSSARALVGTAW